MSNAIISKMLVTALIFLITLVYCQEVRNDTETPVLGCECVSGWTDNDLNCPKAVADGIIDILQAYLTLDTINCIPNCDEEINFECQQTLSLLTQYYNTCPRGTVNEELIHSYWSESKCSDCSFNTYYVNQNQADCRTDTLICDNVQDVETAIQYVSINCVNGTECATDCSSNWTSIAEYSRMCNNNLDSSYYKILNTLYNGINTMECNMDCNLNNNLPIIDCTDSLNVNHSKNLETFGKLNISSIRDQMYLCFYSFNVEDPTKYDLICYPREKLNESGVMDYYSYNSTLNDNFWDSFAFSDDMDMLWILIAAALVFFMQLGFSLLEAGTIKATNVQNILFKNTMDACIGAILFYLFGYCV
eukprot:444913_1